MVKKKKLEFTHQKVIVCLGYILFALIVIGIIFSTVIPWGQLLLQPHVRYWNVWTVLLALVAGAILPTLIAYFIGDKTTRSKNKLMHHYNGVLFGVLAFWLAPLFSFIGSSLISSLRLNNVHNVIISVVTLWPVLTTVIVLAIVAIIHARSHTNGSVLAYAPYRALLLVTVLLANTVPVLLYPPTSKDDSIRALVSIAAPVIFIAISYAVLQKRKNETRLNRLMLAVVAVSIGVITMSAVAQIMPRAAMASGIINSISMVVSIIFGVAVWIFCLWSARRTI